MDHSVDPVAMAGDHLVKGGLVPILEAVHQHTIQGNLLGFGGHAFRPALIRMVRESSHDFAGSDG